MNPFDSIRRVAAHLGVPDGTLGNVAVLPGILETDLKDQNGRALWIVPPAFAELRLGPNGIAEDHPGRVVSENGSNFVCAALIAALETTWNVLAVGYDWRRDLNATATNAAQRIHDHFHGQSFHIVAHSMGGLVARLMKAQFPNIQRGGRLVMIGTPNHGSHLAVRALTIDEDARSFLKFFGITAPPASAMATARTWPGAYQLLPCPRVDPAIRDFYRNPPSSLSRQHLQSAQHLHEQLDALPADNQTFSILGSHVPTHDGEPTLTLQGDGVVSHRLGKLEGAATYSVFGDHVGLPSHPLVIAAVATLLTSGTAPTLTRQAG